MESTASGRRRCLVYGEREMESIFGVELRKKVVGAMEGTMSTTVVVSPS